MRFQSFHSTCGLRTLCVINASYLGSAVPPWGITVSGNHCILHRNGETCPKFWTNWWKQDLDCLPSTQPHLAMQAGSPPSPPSTEETPAANLSLGNSCSLLKASGAFLPSNVLSVMATHFLLKHQSKAPKSYQWDSSTRRRGGMNPACRAWTDVLCKVVTEPQTIFQAPRQAPGQECHRGRNCLQELQFFLSQTPLHSRASGLVSMPVLVCSSAPLTSRSPSRWCLLLLSKATARVVVTAGWEAHAKSLKSPPLKINRCCFRFLKTTWD